MTMRNKKIYICPVIDIDSCFDPEELLQFQGSYGTGGSFSKGDMFDDGFEDDFSGWDDIELPKVIQ